MIKIKTFTCEYTNILEDELDYKVNKWLEENQDIKVIDIKYQVTMTTIDEFGYEAAYDSVLIIYKEVQNDED